MKTRCSILFFSGLLGLISCTNLPQSPQQNSKQTEKNIKKEQSTFVNKAQKNITSAVNDYLDLNTLTKVQVGPNQDVKTLNELFSKEKVENMHIVLDEGNFYTDDIWIRGKNILLEGTEKTSLLCKRLYENVLWISGENIVIRNLHMKHFAPGDLESQNCTGRVISFDNARNVLIEGCDLNGCGLAGLHDNFGNVDVLIKDNYIHNNSVGAYTDAENNVWQEAVDDHPAFSFQNNRIENNGPPRKPEPSEPEEYIINLGKADKESLLGLIMHKQDAFQGLSNPFTGKFLGTEMGDYFQLNFVNIKDDSKYDFGEGNNNYSDYRLFDEDYIEDPQTAGQLFTVYWEWKKSSFPCCDGSYNKVKAYVPSITKLELISE